jgi:hypothetical protein
MARDDWCKALHQPLVLLVAGSPPLAKVSPKSSSFDRQGAERDGVLPDCNVPLRSGSARPRGAFAGSRRGSWRWAATGPGEPGRGRSWSEAKTRPAPGYPGPNAAGSSRQQVNAPSNKQSRPQPEEIEVIDPRHPLHGRRFRVRSITRQLHSPGLVFVAYRDAVTLRIPLAATDLASCPGQLRGTKLSSEAIHEFLSLIQECEASCRNQRASGSDSPSP